MKIIDTIVVENNATGTTYNYKASKPERKINWNYHHDGRLLVIFETYGEGKDDWQPIAHLTGHSMVHIKFKEVKDVRKKV